RSQALKEMQQAVLSNEMVSVELLDLGGADERNTLQAICSREYFHRRSERNIRKPDVLLNGTSRVTLGNVCGNRVRCVCQLGAKLEIDSGIDKRDPMSELEQLHRLLPHD